MTAPIAAGMAAARVAAAAVAAAGFGTLGTSALYHRVDWGGGAALDAPRRPLDDLRADRGSLRRSRCSRCHGSRSGRPAVKCWGRRRAGDATGVIARRRHRAKWSLAWSRGARLVAGRASRSCRPRSAGGRSASRAATALRARRRHLRARRPNPMPGVFGYHEVFHALVLAAAAIHYAVVASPFCPRVGPRSAQRDGRQRKLCARAHARQRAALAGGRARVAGAPPVAQQVHVQLELLAGRGRGASICVVQLLERRARGAAARAGADARDVGVDGDVAQAEA